MSTVIEVGNGSFIAGDPGPLPADEETHVHHPDSVSCSCGWINPEPAGYGEDER